MAAVVVAAAVGTLTLAAGSSLVLDLVPTGYGGSLSRAALIVKHQSLYASYSVSKWSRGWKMKLDQSMNGTQRKGIVAVHSLPL